jgi:hypothetical protein
MMETQGARSRVDDIVATFVVPAAIPLLRVGHSERAEVVTLAERRGLRRGVANDGQESTEVITTFMKHFSLFCF